MGKAPKPAASKARGTGLHRCGGVLRSPDSARDPCTKGVDTSQHDLPPVRLAVATSLRASCAGNRRRDRGTRRVRDLQRDRDRCARMLGVEGNLGGERTQQPPPDGGGVRLGCGTCAVRCAQPVASGARQEFGGCRREPSGRRTKLGSRLSALGSRLSALGSLNFIFIAAAAGRAAGHGDVEEYRTQVPSSRSRGAGPRHAEVFLAGAHADLGPFSLSTPPPRAAMINSRQSALQRNATGNSINCAYLVRLFSCRNNKYLGADGRPP